MSISRQVLTSPFEIQSKPRATQSSNRGVNRSVNNIMTDSRVVRRSTFNPSVGTDKSKRVNMIRNENESRQCVVLFDKRLMNRDIFASPIVTVIEVKENADLKTKQVKSPVSSRNLRSIHFIIIYLLLASH